VKLATIVDTQNGTNTAAEVAQILGAQTGAAAQPVPGGGGSVDGSAMTETTNNESTTMSKARLAANERSAVK
jgi:hypothetical protein